MNTVRKGKIARLPEPIREQLNRRLSNHESSTPLLKWLDSLPEVRTVMTEEFGGKSVYKQNLHEWRQGGHADWRRQQEAVKMLEQLAACGAATAQAAQYPLTDKMTAWLTARYLAAAQKFRAGEEEADWNRLRELCHDMVGLRRGEQHAQRLKFDREKARARLAGI